MMVGLLLPWSLRRGKVPHHVTPTMLLVVELGLTLASGDAFCAH